MVKHFATIMDKNKMNNNLIERTHCALMHIKIAVHSQNNLNICL